LIMNRNAFESLPPRAQAVIRKYSGRWLAEQSATAFEALDTETLARLKADSRRNLVFPSSSDLEEERRVFASVIDAWAAQSPHNRDLVALVRAEIANLQQHK